MTDESAPTAVLRRVLAVFAEVLERHPAEIGPDQTFDELGIDSVANLSIVALLERDYREVPATLLFEHRTVRSVAGFLAGQGPGPAERGAGTATTSAERGAGTATTAAGPRPTTSYDDNDIAVIGVAGRYPGSPDVDALWDRLAAGDSVVTEIPAERWDWRDFFDDREGSPGRSYCRWGGFLPDVDQFDAAFFKILPHDADSMDPQQRLFLENAWTLLQEAGYLGPSTREPETGVFAGSMYATYGRMGAAGWAEGRFTGSDAPAFSIANRVSYFFDFTGPSFAVDSACSSSLTAVHLAAESLRRGECRMAIAGGVNLILHPAHYAGLCAMGMLSHEGACRVFDERADGYVPGEGVGAVLLKPLGRAVADGDRVWAVIRASHVNNDGRTAGYTVPNPVTQAALVRRTHEIAGIDPATISYVETHGTGTVLGDPIEVAGLRLAFEAEGRPVGACAVGSVKANIGHLEGAAGIAGLTKVLLQMKHGAIAPSAELRSINPKIDFAGSPFWPARALAEWKRPVVEVAGEQVTVSRRAGVSSFGAGGANAHVLLEEFLPAPSEATPAVPDGADHVVLLSARTRDQLVGLASALADRIDAADGGSVSLAEVAYTSQVGRAELAERCAVVAADLSELASRLRTVDRAGDGTLVLVGTAGSEAATLALFDEEEGRSMLSSLLANRRLTKVARLWTVGVTVDWRGPWGADRPRRVSFPPYPFDRRRYWTAEAPVPPPAATTAPAGPPDPAGTVVPPASAASDPVAATAQDRSADDGPPSAAALAHELRLIACGFLMVTEAEVDMRVDLMDLGFDSISLTDFVERLNERYRLELPVSVIFDAPTLAELSQHLLDHHAEDIAVHDRAD